MRSLAANAHEVGAQHLAGCSREHRKLLGQFLTLPEIGAFMARQLGPLPTRMRLLDPGAGSAVLACAVVDRLIKENATGSRLEIECFEVDPALARFAHKALMEAKKTAASAGIAVDFVLKETDFVLDITRGADLDLFVPSPALRTFDFVIANPPYGKLNQKRDERVRAARKVFSGTTNLYTLFVGLSVICLKPGGCCSFITPRSFLSGDYFRRFRRDLFAATEPLGVHVFEARDRAFERDGVLQENIIFSLRRRKTDVTTAVVPDEGSPIRVSFSQDQTDLESAEARNVPWKRFLDPANGHYWVRLPLDQHDDRLLDGFDQWSGRIEAYGWHISTGPVVRFRLKQELSNADEVISGKGDAVPLLCLCNVRADGFKWPVQRRRQVQGILRTPTTERWLTPRGNYVLLRRFTAKEERRRLTAAPLLAKELPYDVFGIDNHLNFLYGKRDGFTTSEAVGLAAFLNSAIVDRYFRLLNGNTQVNAAEIRSLPFAPAEFIRRLGDDVQELALHEVENHVAERLRDDFPFLRDVPSIADSRVPLTIP